LFFSITTVLPNLSLNLNKEFKNEKKSENINNISNTIIINKEPVTTLTTSTNSLDPIKPISIEKSNTPEIIKVFKEYLLKTILDYFKNELILLNYILEVSKHIVFREENLINLISILVTDCEISRIKIDHEMADVFKTYGCCAKLPFYCKITSIIIDNKYNFEVNYNTYSQINYILQKSEMDFVIETEKITTNTIEKFITILLSMIPLVQANKWLLQILLSKMHKMFVWFQVKFNISFSQMVCMLWMMVRIKEILPYRPDLCGMSPFTILT
jgi:hypothetical protein